MENISANNKMKNLIEDIIKTEWAFFDKVQNEGGRAECQDDWKTFSIMRRSQYLAWSPALLESWMDDLREAIEDGDATEAIKKFEKAVDYFAKMK